MSIKTVGSYTQYNVVDESIYFNIVWRLLRFKKILKKKNMLKITSDSQRTII
jgi:hypothetical protein